MPIITIHLKRPGVTIDHLGLIPFMLDPDDPKKAREQFNEMYQHGGGWRPQPKWELLEGDVLQYPEDPPLSPIAEIDWGRPERILMYDYGIVAIVQPDGSFEACRMD